MTRSTESRLIVCSYDASSLENTRELALLLRHLKDAGQSANLVLVTGGEYVSLLSDCAELTVLDRFRAEGTGGALAALGLRSLAQRYATWRTHRCFRQAHDCAWILCDHRAGSVLQLLRREPTTVISHLITDDFRLAQLGPTDRKLLLKQVKQWFTLTERQATDIRRHAPTSNIEVIGSLWHPDEETGLVPIRDPGGPVLLSTPSNTWDSLGHAIEIVAKLVQSSPDIRVTWLTDPGDDAWLARHDLGRLSSPLSERVTVRIRGDRSPLSASLLIRTGYEASDPHLVLTAAAAGIPTIGFEVGDLPDIRPTPVPAFDVGRLVDVALNLLDQPAIDTLGAGLASAVRQRADHRELRHILPLLHPPL